MLSALLASGRSSFLILNNSVQEKPGQLSDSQSLEHSTQCKQLHLSCVCVCVYAWPAALQDDRTILKYSQSTIRKDLMSSGKVNRLQIFPGVFAQMRAGNGLKMTVETNCPRAPLAILISHSWQSTAHQQNCGMVFFFLFVSSRKRNLRYIWVRFISDFLCHFNQQKTSLFLLFVLQ